MLIIVNNVHDVQCLRNFFEFRVSQNFQFITDLMVLKTSFVYFAEEISKNQREIIFIIVNLFSSSCSSWLSLQNSDQLNFCNRIENSFTTCILLALRFSIFRILIYSTNIFYFYTKISHFPFFTSLLSIFLFLSTNFLKFIIKRSNKSTISWKISFFNLQTF